MTVSQKLGEKVYAASQAEQANADAGAAGNNKGNVDDDVVDAEVKEVKKD
jgi:molecular chaperone DnaK